MGRYFLGGHRLTGLPNESLQNDKKYQFSLFLTWNNLLVLLNFQVLPQKANGLFYSVIFSTKLIKGRPGLLNLQYHPWSKTESVASVF